MSDKQTWDVWTGRPSWHQQRAGNHLGAACTSGFTSRAEAEAFAAGYAQLHPTEPVIVVSAPAAVEAPPIAPLASFRTIVTDLAWQADTLRACYGQGIAHPPMHPASTTDVRTTTELRLIAIRRMATEALDALNEVGSPAAEEATECPGCGTVGVRSGLCRCWEREAT